MNFNIRGIGPRNFRETEHHRCGIVFVLANAVDFGQTYANKRQMTPVAVRFRNRNSSFQTKSFPIYPKNNFFQTKHYQAQFSSQKQSNGEESTHFGFKTVNANEKAGMVANIFHSVANKYDLMNDVMSGTIHRQWKDTVFDIYLYLFRQLVADLAPVPGATYLDVAGGTGDIAFRILEAVKSSSLYSPLPKQKTQITVCDINGSMLQVGQERAKAKGYGDGHGIFTLFFRFTFQHRTNTKLGIGGCRTTSNSRK